MSSLLNPYWYVSTGYPDGLCTDVDGVNTNVTEVAGKVGDPTVVNFMNGLSETPDGDALTMGSAYESRRGERAETSSSAMLGYAVTNVTFKLKRVGTPTGTASVDVTNASGVVQENIGTISEADLQALGTDWTDIEIENLQTTYPIEENDQVALTYAGGDGSNYIIASRQSDFYDGVNSVRTYGTGSPSVDSSTDTIMKIDGSNTGAYYYNGSSSKTVLGSASDWNFLSSATSNVWTISFWLKYEDSISPGHTFMSTTDGSTQNYGMFIDVLSGGNIRLIQVNGTSATWTGVLSDSDWHFYVFTWKSDGTTELWFDGVSQGTKSQTATSSDVQNPLTLAVNNDEYWIKGKFDDMAVWSGTAITEDIIAELTNAPDSFWVTSPSSTTGTSIDPADSNIVTMGTIAGWGNKIRGKDITNSSEQVIEFEVNNTTTNSFIGIANGTDSITNGFYLTSGSSIYWKDSSSEADTGETRASGDKYKIIWGENGDVDLYLDQGSGYGSSLKQWTGVSGTRQAYIESYASAVITFLPSAPINGSPVSDLADRSDIVAYYNFNSTTSGLVNQACP